MLKQSIAPFIQTQRQQNYSHSDIDNVFRSIYCTIMIKIPKYQEKHKVGLLI